MFWSENAGVSEEYDFVFKEINFLSLSFSEPEDESVLYGYQKQYTTAVLYFCLHSEEHTTLGWYFSSKSAKQCTMDWKWKTNDNNHNKLNA